jgi:Tol biopolymer transport system component
MRLGSLLKPWPLAAIWTLICLILMIVGFVLFASAPGGSFSDVVAISDADVAAVALGLWLLGLVVLIAVVGLRRLPKGVRRAFWFGAALVAGLIVAAGSCGESTGSKGFRWRDDDATWSPGGAVIAFVSNRAHPDTDASQLYVIRADGTSLRRLTRGGSAAYPRFSPDGRRIVYFESSNGNSPELDLIGADGGGRRIVVSSEVLDPTIPPAWSPNGRWIAFVKNRNIVNPAAAMDLWLVAPDGSRPRRVAKQIDESSFSPLFAWSPDSRYLAFGCRSGGVCVIAAQGGGRARVITRAGFDGESTASVDWSRDGAELAFLRDTPGPDIESSNQYSWVIDANGGGEHRLPRFGGGSVDQLVWVPKHPRLLIAAGDGTGHIYLVRSDSSGKRDLRAGGWDYEPVRSPDGAKIAWGSETLSASADPLGSSTRFTAGSVSPG